jgi:peptide/nickel transport system substrate-binding protein
VSDSVLLNVFEPLVMRGADLQTKTALAERWEHPSPERWRFHLRKGVTFHDGTPLTASVARDALLRVKGDPTLATSSFLEQVVRIEAAGEDDLDLVTSEPRALLPSLLSVYIAKPNAAGSFPPFVGTGPYRLAEWTPRKRVVLEGWSGYRGKRPWIEKAAFVPVLDARERLSRLQKGEADIAYAPPSDVATGSPPKGTRIVRGPGLTVYYLAFNVRETPRNPFRDVRVRRAFHLALNRQELVSRAMPGLGAVATQPVSPLVFGYNARIPAPRFDPAGARALLAEAGWAKGLRTRLDIPEARLATGLAVKQALGDVGVEVELHAMPGHAVYDLAESGKSDFFFAGWDCTSGEASEFYEFNLRTPSSRSGRGNYGGWSNRRLDELAERNAATLEAGPRKALLQEAAPIVMDELPILPLFIEDNLFAVRRGVDLSPPADGEIRLMELGGGRR